MVFRAPPLRSPAKGLLLGRAVLTLPRVELAGDEPARDLATTADADKEGLSSERAPVEIKFIGEQAATGAVIRRGRLAERGAEAGDSGDIRTGVAITVAGIRLIDASPTGLDAWAEAVTKLETSRLCPHFLQNSASAM